MSPARLTRHQQGIVALLFANVIWGAAPAIFKLALISLPPFTLAFLRFFAASLLLFPFAARRLHIHRHDWAPLFVMSFFGITMNIAFFFFGLMWAPSVNAAIIGTSAPLLLFLASLFIFHERAKRKILIGTLIGIIGIAIIIGQPAFGTSGPAELLGDLFFVLATMGSIGYTLVSKSLTRRYAPITITFWSFFIGSLTFFPFFMTESARYHTLSVLDTHGVVGLIFGIFLSSALAYFLYEWGLARIQTQEIGLFASVDPIVAAVFSVLLLGESVTWSTLIGTLFILGGLFLAELRLPYLLLRQWRTFLPHDVAKNMWYNPRTYESKHSSDILP